MARLSQDGMIVAGRQGETGKIPLSQERACPEAEIVRDAHHDTRTGTLFQDLLVLAGTSHQSVLDRASCHVPGEVGRILADASEQARLGRV
jgi:hypothetical protein